MVKIKTYNIKDLKGDLREIVLFEDVTKIIDQLEAKRKYWELKFKKEETQHNDLQEDYNISLKEINRLRGELYGKQTRKICFRNRRHISSC